MAQRTPPPRPSRPDPSTRGTRGAGGRSGASRKVRVAPVRKGFPWGFAAGALALVLVLAGVLTYAVANTGSGFRTAADRLDESYDGIAVTRDPAAGHVTARVAYDGAATRAPDSGEHSPYPQTCAVYDAPIVNEHAVHSMEHGAVWATYRPDLPADQVAVLKTLVEGNSSRLLSPYPGQSSPVAMQAWGRRLDLPAATDPRVQRFADDYTQGPQTREKGASCSGVSQPGTEPFVPGPDGQSFVPAGAAGPDGPAAPADPGAGAVPGTRPVPAPTPCPGRSGDVGQPGQAPHDGDQLVGVERLGQVGVHADPVAPLQVGLLGEGGQQHDLHRRGVRVVPQPARRLPAVEPRHHDVERDDGRGDLLHPVQAVLPVDGGRDLEALELQVDGDQLPDDVVVVHHEDPAEARHPRRLAAACGRPGGCAAAGSVTAPWPP